MKKYAILFLSCLLIAFCCFQSYQETTHPDEFENPDFYYICQPDDITCGPTSTAMLLHYYGKAVTVQEVENRTCTKWFRWNGKDIGMTAPDYLPIALRHFGVPARQHRGSLDQLKHYVSQGRPPIVLVRSGETTWHYVVVIGYTQESVITADPGSGARETMSVETFRGCWAFTHDMNGILCGIPCPACNKTGKGWIGSCDLCGGRGSIDPLKELLWAGEVYSHTMIVPSPPCPKR